MRRRRTLHATSGRLRATFSEACDGVAGIDRGCDRLLQAQLAEALPAVSDGVEHAVGPGTEEVIARLYIHPAKDAGGDAQVRSWVRADAAELDGPLYAAVSRWLIDPFELSLCALQGGGR